MERVDVSVIDQTNLEHDHLNSPELIDSLEINSVCSFNCCLRRHLASREGIVALGVHLCVSAELQLHAACHISLGSDGNMLYPVLLVHLLVCFYEVKC